MLYLCASCALQHASFLPQHQDWSGLSRTCGYDFHGASCTSCLGFGPRNGPGYTGMSREGDALPSKATREGDALPSNVTREGDALPSNVTPEGESPGNEARDTETSRESVPSYNKLREGYGSIPKSRSGSDP